MLIRAIRDSWSRFSACCNGLTGMTKPTLNDAAAINPNWIEKRHKIK